MGYTRNSDFLDDTWGGFVSNSPRDIADNMISLYTNRDTWKKVSDKGLSLMEELFSYDKNAGKLNSDILEALKKKSVGESDLIQSIITHASDSHFRVFSKHVLFRNTSRGVDTTTNNDNSNNNNNQQQE
eukprot:TRINITY_DN4535_c0_g1_i1.p1 TRINITY_DN4535_c0_g1~~TRINITY_DN4535_c0_g1_i1.p1  ORF type:complete len:129 (-),score=36.05 TRINITY_DN4535_c0_g1_i1:52-438(-)